MRVVTFNGWPVKRQKKIAENKILLRFYERPPITVTSEEWEADRRDHFFSDSVQRSQIVRTKNIKGNHEHDHNKDENATEELQAPAAAT